jgi:A/G-specific adenine glycosylase
VGNPWRYPWGHCDPSLAALCSMAMSVTRRGRSPARTPAAGRASGAPRIQQALLAWYGRNARDLPWRRTRDPYRLWVSEVMLQQTRVETVLPYYEAFVLRFPDLATLAAAPIEAVLKAWEGLGYYRRARAMHAASLICVDRYGGLPPSFESFRSLPGVGDYTAAAVWAIARGEPHLPLDGNVRRVLARLGDLDTVRDRDYREAGEPLLRGLTGARVRAMAQALMELGALICRPRNPLCPTCPVHGVCRARRAGTVAVRPRARARPRGPHHQVAIAYLRDRAGRVLLVHRPNEGFLGGLWELPGGKVEPGEEAAAALRRELREEARIDRLRTLQPVGAVEHAYTHFRVTLQLFEAETSQRGRLGDGPAEIRWVDPERLGDYAVPRGTRKALAMRERAAGASGRASRRGSGPPAAAVGRPSATAP